MPLVAPTHQLTLSWSELSWSVGAVYGNICCSSTWVDIKHILNHNPNPTKGRFLPLFNVNLSQPQLNSTPTQFQLNFDSTLSQPHFNLSLKSISDECVIKATQSCCLNFLIFAIWRLFGPYRAIFWLDWGPGSEKFFLVYSLVGSFDRPFIWTLFSE